MINPDDLATLESELVEKQPAYAQHSHKLFLTVEEAAAYSGLSESAVTALVGDGRLPTFDVAEGVPHSTTTRFGSALMHQLDNQTGCTRIRHAVMRLEDEDTTLSLWIDGVRFPKTFPACVSFARIREELRVDGVIVLSGPWCFKGHTTRFDVLF